MPFLGDLAHGAGVHQEPQHRVEAGPTPAAAPHAATATTARRFHLSDRGRIADGLRADVLLADGAPTTITDTLNTRAVWAAEPVWPPESPPDRGSGPKARPCPFLSSFTQRGDRAMPAHRIDVHAYRFGGAVAAPAGKQPAPGARAPRSAEATLEAMEHPDTAIRILSVSITPTPRTAATPGPGAAPQGRQAGRERAASRVRAGPTLGPGPPARRNTGPGPGRARWKGRNKLHRQGRRWVTAWSMEQIAHRLEVDFPEDESVRMSHEAIHQALFVEGRGALRCELVASLRTGRALRVPRARSRRRPAGHVTSDVMIGERPAEADDRAVPGHGEGDLIIGTGRSAIGTLAERTTRFMVLLHLPRMEGYGVQPRVNNGPAPAGCGAEAMKDAIAARLIELPAALRRSLTWDRGKELARDTLLRCETNCWPTLPTRTARGSAARTRTPTDCCVSTFPRH